MCLSSTPERARVDRPLRPSRRAAAQKKKPTKTRKGLLCFEFYSSENGISNQTLTAPIHPFTEDWLLILRSWCWVWHLLRTTVSKNASR